ncbi:MAG: UDP-N-Acetylglucosamine 2-epimerase [Verrucomicrobiaceae bacterium]|nr:UDP-N-Acetylglucosamine 2-epimerase [Verrucomicrobiaceae bacterium]
MKQHRVLVLLGTRPEVIKLAPVIMALRARADQIETVVCSTGQHREMFDQAMNGFGLKADIDLGLMTPGQTLASITSQAFAAVDKVIEQVQPTVLIVQGDTTSAMVGAMCGFYRRISVGHVEAGLRTGDIQSPFPEEVNRCIVGKIASLHFAPTQRSADNLLREGVPAASIHVTGNTVVDALRWMRERLPKEAPAELPEHVTAAISQHRLLLVTGHRRESFGDGIASICNSLRQLAEEFPDTFIVYPVHLNPNVQQPVRAILSDHPRIALLPPVAYATLLWLMERATLILSDSGGIQEEAPSFGKPLLILRDTTERPEVVDAGCARLIGTTQEAILSNARALLSNAAAYAEMTAKPNPFGDGRAADRIVDAVMGS